MVIVGGVTLLMGAIIGCAKDDIKKVLAGSTMSQIGYMVVGAGLGPVGYAFAIFHLVNHGFFKANLFLGAGSVMHAKNDTVDMRRFGALRKVMMVTFVTFFLGYLAIIGIPPFSGFFSKDKIIEAAFDPRDRDRAGVALLGAGVTGVLHDPARGDDVHRQGTLAGGPPSARVADGDAVPMVVLAVCRRSPASCSPERRDRALAGAGHRARRAAPRDLPGPAERHHAGRGR